MPEHPLRDTSGFLRRHWERFGGTLVLLAHACQRISLEFRELGRAQKGATGTYDALVYVHPVEVAQRDDLRRAYVIAAGSGKAGAEPADDLPAAVPCRNGAFYLRVNTPTADHAAMICLTLTREALAIVGIEATEVRVEAVPA